MGRTFIGVNSPQAVKRWGSGLAVATNKKQYFAPRFMGYGRETTMPIMVLVELENNACDNLKIDLLMPGRAEPRAGGQPLSGYEEPMRIFQDDINIDQIRYGVDVGDRMSRKRTLHDLRSKAKRIIKDWWARAMDELLFIHLSGARGVAQDFLWSDTNEHFQVNQIVTPDAMHTLYGGAATSKGSLAGTDHMDLRMIDRSVARAETMGGGTTDDIHMLPTDVAGSDKYVCLMHTFQFDKLKSSPATGQWLDIQKAAAAANGYNNAIFKGGEGEYAGTVIHKHRNVIQFNDYGAGNNVRAGRAIFMGAQAVIVAYGSNGNGVRYEWSEELKDHGDKLAVGTACIVGVKASGYKDPKSGNRKDFGRLVIDTALTDPNA
jgi:N4-gp56 family major capsid protein